MSERSLGYALLDNVIGFDDDYRTAGERLGSAIKDNPRAVAKSVVDGVTGSIGDFATRVREEGPASALTGSLQDYSESILGAGLNLSSGTQGYMDRGMTQAEARDAQLGDAMLVSELIPLVGGAGLAARSAKSVVPEAPSDPSRRDFMAKGAAAAGVAAIMPEELLKQAGKVLSKAPKGSLGSVLGNLENIDVLSNDLYRKIEELRKKIGDKATERTLRSNPRLKNILIDEQTMKEVGETRPIVEDIDILSDQLDKGEFQRGVLVRETLEDLTPEKIANATSSEIEEFLHHVMSSPTTIMESVLEPSDRVEFLNFEGLLKEAQRRGMHEEIVDGLNTKDHGMDAVAYPTTRMLYQEFLGEYKGEKFAEGGEVMNRMEQGIASIPRQTAINDQPHMLAYITPAEALMLKKAGGAGIPGPGGIPTFLTFRNGKDVTEEVNREKQQREKEYAEKAAAGGFRGGIFGDMDGDGKVDSLKDWFKDITDGGGAGYSGARFGARGGQKIDNDGDGYISEQEYSAYEKANPQGYKDHGNFISGISNTIGARPSGSYAAERGLGRDGTNIGTTGIANYLTQGTLIGNILMGGKPTSMSRAVPELELNVPLNARYEGARLRPLKLNPVGTNSVDDDDDDRTISEKLLEAGQFRGQEAQNLMGAQIGSPFEYAPYNMDYYGGGLHSPLEHAPYNISNPYA